MRVAYLQHNARARAFVYGLLGMSGQRAYLQAELCDWRRFLACNNDAQQDYGDGRVRGQKCPQAYAHARDEFVAFFGSTKEWDAAAPVCFLNIV